MRAARSFHHASINAYLYFTYLPTSHPSNIRTLRQDREYNDLDKRLFWGCIKMETRYGVDISLPDSGLASLDLVTEL